MENNRPRSVLPLLPKIFETLFMINLTNIWINIWIAYCVVLGKLIPLNMLYLDLYKNGKMN